MTTGLVTTTDLRTVLTLILSSTDPFVGDGPGNPPLYVDANRDGALGVADLRLVLVALLSGAPQSEPLEAVERSERSERQVSSEGFELPAAGLSQLPNELPLGGANVAVRHAETSRRRDAWEPWQALLDWLESDG